ncbi:MAG TPA: hypothetical protein VF498_14310, partial [Anaerolineales bacterium]
MIRIEGVNSAQVSIAHEEALVSYDPARVSPILIQETLEDIGYTVRQPDQAEIFADEANEMSVARHKAIMAGALLISASVVMGLMLWAGPQAFLTLTMGVLALFTSLGPARFIIFRNGWQSLRRGIFNQDVLASTSALGGLLGGMIGLFYPAWPAGGFFGATVFVLSFHLIGGYASVLVHVRASQSVRRLLALTPPIARRINGRGEESEVFIEDLEAGNLVRVRPGERIPGDGEVA